MPLDNSALLDKIISTIDWLCAESNYADGINLAEITVSDLLDEWNEEELAS